MIDPDDVARRAERVRQRIADAGGDPSRIGIVAVTKGFDASALEAAASAGMMMIGESYAQELRAKWDQLNPEVQDRLEVHFIGRLQSNKVRQLAGLVDLWQSVDRARLVNEISRHRPGAEVFVQLDLSGASTQGGCGLDNAPSLVTQARDAGLDVRGCMAIGPQGSPADIEAAFTEVSRFADRHDLEHRCIGMSADLEQAVRAGSTVVRIGAALFGERPARITASGGD
ncbi:YggS family pyridoxal phosphate-dependent enzyme [Candidatus Poriferisodalis sp.]|uniref:YggS family pyridoxal phosphate-dependent enzyme n=1 Tax=Candidatus Poriferisodalis sp. TaxID=3101277 RepID=UPI003B027AE8